MGCLRHGFVGIFVLLDLGWLSVGLADDLVALQVDLPPDIQRMFEEMCELEGVSQTEMLTRWIDARWEAMGYKDSDLLNLPEEVKEAKEAQEVVKQVKEVLVKHVEDDAQCTTDSCRASKPSQSRESRQSHSTSTAEDEDEDEDETVPDIDTWMRLYGSSEDE